MAILLLTVGANFVVSLGALMGIFSLPFNEKKLGRILLFLVSLAAGVLMGNAFLHLLPEAERELSDGQLFPVVLFSFLLFFLMEKLLQWRHCHQGQCDVHTFGYLNLIGDAVHNFLDGLIIAASFLADVKLGMITTAAVAVHEIPQEISDFGVLLYAGFSKKQALAANFLVALTAVFGGILGYFFLSGLKIFVPYLLAFAAGGFIYIAASDLMPEIRKETNLKKSLTSFAVFLAGVLLMFLLKLI